MKKFILSILLFCNCSIYSQNLTLNELFAICNRKNWDEVNEYLIKKGWEYHESSKGDDTHYNTITWSYEKNRYNEKAQGWFYLYTYEDLPNKLGFTFFKKQTYTSLKAGIAAAGMKLIENTIEDNEIIAKYGNSNFILTVTTERREREDDYGSENSITAYSIVLIKKAGVYDNDNGFKTTYDEYGNLDAEYTLRDGKINGVAKRYHPNGQVKFVSTFVNGQKQGVAKEYDEEGVLTSEFTYVNDQHNGAYKIYEGGKLILTGNIARGEKNGLFKEYDDEGKLRKEYTLIDGLFDGSYTAYYYDENVMYIKVTGQYKKDVQIGRWQTIKTKDKKIDILDSKTYVDGEVDGFYKEVKGDSIIFASKKNGVQEGKYSLYRNIATLLLGGLSGDTSNCPVTEVGYYHEGQKDGLWKYYDFTGTLIKEGFYARDLENGEWKYYYNGYRDEKGNLADYSGKLYLIETYLAGEKNGKEIRYSSLVSRRKQCDTGTNKTTNSSDTCYEALYKPGYYSAFYKKNDLHGQYEQKDSVDMVTFKGNYVNGEKDGYWIESYLNFKRNGTPYYKFFRGNYKNGKEIGKWEQYDSKNIVLITNEYNNGKLDGKTTQWSMNGAAFIVKTFKENEIERIEIFDTINKKLKLRYDILTVFSDFFKCQETVFSADGNVSQEYRIYKGKKEKAVDHWSFLANFNANVKNNNDFSSGFKDGEYVKYDRNEKPLISGSYHKQERVGDWVFYYYDKNLKKEVNISNDHEGIEKYTVLDSGLPYSGKFVELFPNGKEKTEIKIKGGLREGKSKYYSEEGKLVRTEKYEKGQLEQ